MNKQTKAISNDMNQLAEDAKALIAVTGDVAGEQVGEARNRLAAALERVSKIYGVVWKTEVEGAKVVDKCMHGHPYQALLTGIGIGALIGSFVASRCTRCRY